MKVSVRFAVACVVTLFLIYTLSVVLSGLGVHIFGQGWDFSVSGQFGDSFGALNSLMAAIAAGGAVAAYLSQRAELRRLRADRDRDLEIAGKRDFEQTFFNLLKLFREIVPEIDVADKNEKNAVFGRDAMRRILDDYIGHSSSSADVDERNFASAYVKFRDDLAHYFRLLYHIMKFIDTSAVQDKMLYVRLLRATLCDAEIVLIALNCMYGGGKKLRPLVEKYALLHNISAESAREWKMADMFESTAFGDRHSITGLGPSD